MFSTNRILFIAAAFIFLLPVNAILPIKALAQTQSKAAASDVIKCETIEDVYKAQKDGVIFFEFKERFFVRIGSEYKGPFRYLDSAKKLLNQQTITNSTKEQNDAKKQPAASSEGNPVQDTAFYNPQLILFPFVEYTPNKMMLFSIPGGQTVAASQVMIHPEPLEFENVSYGVIDLALFNQNAPQKAQVQPIKPNAPQGKYFVVTGELKAREGVIMPSAALQYSVGAAVVGKDGELLWRQYGSVENDRTFKCVGHLPSTRIQPEFLLLFSLARGKLETNIRPIANFPELDAKPYDYHVLCSSTLEVGPNWFPPMEAATKEEYQKLMQSMKEKQKQKMQQ